MPTSRKPDSAKKAKEIPMAKKPHKNHVERPLRLEWRSPSELAENPANWRRHPESQLAALTDVIAEVGWAGVCLFNETTGRLIDGHARKSVAVAQGAAEVPVLVGNWTEEQERMILATFDPLGAKAEADPAKLMALLADIDTESAAVTAMLAELADSMPEELPEAGGGGDDFDATPVESGPTRTQVGDLWVIGGKHRLLVGDNTIADNVARLMDGAKAGLCFTSPPYAQQRYYGEAAKEKVQDWYALMCGTFANLPMEENGQVLVNLGLIHRDGEWVPYWDGWIAWMREQDWRRFGWYVWDKTHALPGDFGGRFAPAHEWVFHFNREGVEVAKCIEKKPENVKLGGGTGTRNANGQMKGYRSNPEASLTTHKIPDSVIRIVQQMGGVDGHPAPFPIGLPSLVIESWPGDVYDPFLGSGTTLIAAHRLNRVCYGCEIEPRYADVILKRAEAEGLACEKAV